MYWKTDARANGRNENGLVEHMKKELGFTDSQTTLYKKLLQEHRAEMKTNGDSLKKAKIAFYSLAIHESTDSVIKSTNEELTQKQGKMYMLTFQHFRRVRLLCTEEQRPKFDSMLVNLITRNSRFNRGRTNTK